MRVICTQNGKNILPEAKLCRQFSNYRRLNCVGNLLITDRILKSLTEKHTNIRPVGPQIANCWPVGPRIVVKRKDVF